MPPIGVSIEPNVAPYPSLTLTVPATSWAATARPRRPSRVQTLAFRPYSPSFARWIASASSENR